MAGFQLCDGESILRADLFEMRDGFRGVAFGEKGVAQELMRCGEVGVQFQSALEGGDGGA